MGLGWTLCSVTGLACVHRHFSCHRCRSGCFVRAWLSHSFCLSCESSSGALDSGSCCTWCTSLLCSQRKMVGSAVSHWTLVFSCFSCYLGTSTLAWVWSLFVCIYVGFCCICCSWALATSPCGFFVLAFTFALVRWWLLLSLSCELRSCCTLLFRFLNMCSQHDKGDVIFGSFMHSSPSSNICCGPMILQPRSHLSDSRPACSLLIRVFQGGICSWMHWM